MELVDLSELEKRHFSFPEVVGYLQQVKRTLTLGRIIDIVNHAVPPRRSRSPYPGLLPGKKVKTVPADES